MVIERARVVLDALEKGEREGGTAQKALIDKRASRHFRGWEAVGAELTNGRPDMREQIDLWSEHKARAPDVEPEYMRLLGELGPELAILQDLPLTDIAAAGGEKLAAGIARMRADTEARAGQPAEFAINMEKAVFFDPKSEDRIR